MAGLTQPLEFRKLMTSGPKPGLDPVPFLDAMLIALFIALNSSAFVLAPGTTIQLPTSGTMEALESAPTAVLTVDRNELYFFEGSKLATASVETRLKRYVEDLGSEPESAGALLLLKVDSTIPSSTLFELMDIARRAGFARIHLAAEPRDRELPAWENASAR
jgi:biopolymer transport protein ExbD